MPAALRVDTSPAAGEAERAAFEATRDAETRLRYQMVLLAGDGLTAPHIAPLVRRPVAAVQRVPRRYRAGGLAAVPRRTAPGSLPAVTPAWEPELRRRVLRGLNNSEAVHSIGRALFVGQRGEFRHRPFMDQVHRANCPHLLIAAIGTWTTPHLADAVDALRAEGESVPDEYLGHVSPLVWDHVNLLGEYRFDPECAHPLDQRRPLRHEADDDDVGDRR
jgi:hypothetical protein